MADQQTNKSGFLSSVAGNGREEKKTEPETDESRNRPPWIVFAVFLSAAIILLALYGWSVLSAPLLLTELLVGAASMSVGSLLGFLFGMPRSTVAASTNEENDSNSALPYRPSTNLEQVSDWLTKILIGVGLVELSQIGPTLASMGHIVAGSLQNPPPGTEVVTQVVVIAFLVFGFIASFLWTRIYYGPLQTMIDQNLLFSLQSKLKKVENKLSDQASATQNVETVTKLLATGKLAAPSVTPSKMQLEAFAREAVQETLPAEVRDKLKEFQEMEADWNSDPGAELFSNATPEANGRKLEAVLEAEFSDYLVIKLRVQRLGGEPLQDEVAFLLHPTYDNPILYRQPQNDAAEIEILSEGWFTAVAVLDQGRTILSYDLRNLSGAPDWFKEA